MKKIKDIKLLRKLLSDTDWLSMTFTEDEVESQFPENGHRPYKVTDNPNEDVFQFDKTDFHKRVNTKTKSYDYILRMRKVGKGGYSIYGRKHDDDMTEGLREKIFGKDYKDYDKHPYSFYRIYGCYETGLDKVNVCDTIIYSHDLTGEILAVTYKDVDDYFYNKFLKEHLDTSILNNYEEVYSFKDYVVLTKKVQFKKVKVSARTEKEAITNCQKICIEKNDGYFIDRYSYRTKVIRHSDDFKYIDDKDITEKHRDEHDWYIYADDTKEKEFQKLIFANKRIGTYTGESK